MGSSKNRENSDFWGELEERLRVARMTKAQFSKRLGISPQGLSTWRERHQFRRQCLPIAAEVLGWPALDEDAAVKVFGLAIIEGRILSQPNGELDPFHAALRQANRAYRRIEPAFQKYAKHTLTVLDTLGEGSFFAFSSSTTSPFEFEKTPEGRNIALSVAQAISRGVLCLYIRPTAKGVAYYTRSWGYGRVVEYEEAVKEMKNFRSLVKNDLMRGVGDRKIPPAEAERLVYERLDQCYVDRSPMWLPGVGLSMFGQFRSRELTARVAISLPGGRFGGVLLYPQYYALEFRFGRFLRKVVVDAYRDLKASREDTPDGRVHLLVTKEHRRSTERFYERYSQLLRTVISIDPPDSALA